MTGVFDPEDRDAMIPPKVGHYSPTDTASHYRNTAENLRSLASFRAIVNSTQLSVQSLDSACVNLLNSAINR